MLGLEGRGCAHPRVTLVTYGIMYFWAPYFGLSFRIVGPPYFGVHSVFRIVYYVFHTSFWVQICIPYYVSAPSMIHSSLV